MALRRLAASASDAVALVPAFVVVVALRFGTLHVYAVAPTPYEECWAITRLAYPL